MITMSVTLLLVLVALQLADYLTTRRILALGGRERNPVVRWLINGLGEHGGLVAAKALVAVLAVVGALLLGPYDVWALAALDAFYVLILLNNRRVIASLSTTINDAGPTDD